LKIFLLFCPKKGHCWIRAIESTKSSPGALQLNELMFHYIVVMDGTRNLWMSEILRVVTSAAVRHQLLYVITRCAGGSQLRFAVPNDGKTPLDGAVRHSKTKPTFSETNECYLLLSNYASHVCTKIYLFHVHCDRTMSTQCRSCYVTMESRGKLTKTVI